MNWRRMDTYQPGSRALFWVDDGYMRYMFFGVLEDRASEGFLRIWDDNDAGYAPASAVLARTHCSPPRWLMH